MIELIFIFIIGTSIGSFLNVVIYRTEKGISIINPPSFCPECKSKIKWYDNIPIISYIILKGRCRNCLNKISIQYPLIEFITGFITLVIFSKWGKSNLVWFLFFSAISYLLILISAIDFKTMMLSDLFSYLLAFSGMASSFSNPIFEGSNLIKLRESFSGILTGAAIIYLIMKIGKIIYKKDAIGEGDIFLLGAIGSFVGGYGIIDVLIIASFIGALYGVSLMFLQKLNRFSYIPFGPFLAIGSFLKVYFNIKVFNIFS